MSAKGMSQSILRTTGTRCISTRGSSSRHLDSTVRLTTGSTSEISAQNGEISTATLAQGSSVNLLFIDRDTPWMREHIRRTFQSPSVQVDIVTPKEFASEIVIERSADVVILALDLPGGCGQLIYEQIRQVSTNIPVIFLADCDQADVTIEALKNGAFDCLFKPLDWTALRLVVSEAVRVARTMRHTSSETGADAELTADDTASLIGSCPAMREVYKEIGRVAAQSVPVLITGETGTGKDVVARSLHRHGARTAAKFMALNCAAVPESLLESELFGHEKGAFTGADQRRIGKFEQCNGGTLFLDEIGDMPLTLQAKLLRVLQEQTFERIGGNESVKTDVRLVAATHRDLKAWSDQGQFRADLYYRLSVFNIHLPPLRERGDDLELLVRTFVRRFSQEFGRQVCEVAPESIERLRAYRWPGNVRELQSVLKQALLRASGHVLLPSFLPSLVNASELNSEVSGSSTHALAIDDLVNEHLSPTCRDLYASLHRELDRTLLLQVLDYVHGSQHQAARLLGIARQTLRLKMKESGIHVTRSIAANMTDTSYS